MAENPDFFAKTKILATLGPSTNQLKTIEELIKNGIDGVRINLSHCDQSVCASLFEKIHQARIDEVTPLAILADLQGPKIRIGELITPTIEIKDNDFIEITVDDIKGDSKIISSSYKSLADDADIGNQILIDDGLIRMRIVEKKSRSVMCLIESGGILKPRKGMNLPGMKLSTPAMTPKDYENLDFILQYNIDFVALSFVRSASDVVELKKWISDKGFNIPVIAKIEKKEAVDSFDEILKAADGIMVARGDLGVEFPPQDVPVLQKMIIKKCNEVGKLVITATQMLESMINSPIPTRAEASDVANAVWDGTDVVMLSGETSVGKYPVQTVKIMNDIVRKAESNFNINRNFVVPFPEIREKNLFDSVGRAIVNISNQIKADAIVLFTIEGRTARNVAKFRPTSRIIAISNNFDTMNNLCLYWGIASLYLELIDKEHTAIDTAKQMILEAGLVKEGDMVIFSAGAPYSERSRFNWFRYETM